mmetsp:Transcript_27790/g.45231  ORF Transcript_27790/g.45231 Transcript_27790/m.45231 type:complete len:152 (-) Transcript_27790:2311-2766(-)
MKSFKKDSRTLAQWHRALNHVSEAVIKRTAKAVNGMVITDGGKYACESCDLTKLNKRTFSKQKTTTAKDAMDRWDADTKGILKKSRDGDKYYRGYDEGYRGVPDQDRQEAKESAHRQWQRVYESQATRFSTAEWYPSFHRSPRCSRATRQG